MAPLSMLSFAAFSASLWASAPDAQAVLSRFLRSAAYKRSTERPTEKKKEKKRIRKPRSELLRNGWKGE
jgi:hypothetical protein